MRRPKSPLRTPFVVTVASAMVACGGGVAGGDPGIIVNPPAKDHVDPPTHQTDCSNLNVDAPCTTGDSCGKLCTGDPEYKCIDGAWQGFAAGCNPPAQSCPATLPADGSSCSGMEGRTCDYTTSTDCPPETAACDAKTATWTIAISTCNPPPPVDAGGG
jgi:hypothetical protein